MEVIVIKLGLHETGNSDDKKLNRISKDICSSVILLKGETNILVDSGYRGYGEEILSEIRKNGVRPEEIEYIINTHFHFDHCYNNFLFPNAKIVLSNLLWKPKGVDAYKSVGLIDVPGVKIFPTPGHVEGHNSILVEKNGEKIVAAGDAVREEDFRNHFFKGHPNEKQIMESALRVLKMSDRIIPGHGQIIEGGIKEELIGILEKE